jgi:ATP-binding cassette subfamily F protein uup
MERMGGKIIELHKISKFKDRVILEPLVLISSVANALGLSGKNGTGKIDVPEFDYGNNSVTAEKS